MDFDNNNNINEEGISISELWTIFKARFAWFLLTLILVVAGAFVYLQYAVPQYSSTVTILVEPITSSSSLDSFMMGDISGGSSKISTEVELFTSRTNIDAALELLDLSKYKDSEGITYSDYEKVYENPFTIRPNSDKISVSTVKDTKLISVTITDQNREFATDFANALSVSYDTLLTSIAKTSKTTQREFLEEQIPLNEAELKTATDKLYDFREQSNFLKLSGTTSMLIDQISYYELRKEPLKLQQVDAISKINSIYSSLLSQNINVPTIDELTNSEEFQELKYIYAYNEAEYIIYEAVVSSSRSESSVSNGVKTRTSELVSTSSSTSNKMLDYIKEELKQYSSNDMVVNALLNEYSRAILSYTICDIGLIVLEERSSQFNAKLEELPVVERKISELTRDVTVLQELGIQLRKMLEEVKLIESSLSGNVKVVDSAIVEDKPVSPNKLLIMAVALLLGAALGFLLALVIDMADNTIKTTEQVRQLLKNTTISLLGWVPLMKDQTLHPASKKNQGYKNLSVYDNPTAFDSEKYMTIVSNIVYSGNIKNNKTITVTSCDVSEGKSSLVANMALCLANMGHKVLIVDGDLRMPSIEAKFGYARAKLGLVNFIQEDDVRLEDVILQPIEEMPLLHILPPGRLPLVPISIVSNPKMDELKDLIGPYYDYILVDAPPLDYASEVISFGERFDSIVVNVRANITSKPALKTLLHDLHRVEGNIVGVVLNACLPKDADTTSGGSSKYGYGYANKYGNKGSDTAEKNIKIITSRRKAIKIYKKSLKYRKITDTKWQQQTKPAPLANLQSNVTRESEIVLKKEQQHTSLIDPKKEENNNNVNKSSLKESEKTHQKENKANYDDILNFLENDPSASGKGDE